MLWRIVTKLLLKATVPLFVVGGVLVYADYMRGGDPMAVLSRVGAGIGDQLRTSVATARHDASAAVAGLSSDRSGAQVQMSPSGGTQFHTWQDVNGVTHYSSVAPPGVDTQTVTVNPDTNVLAPMKAPTAVRPSSMTNSLAVPGNNPGSGVAQSHGAARGNMQFSDNQAAAVADLESEMGEPLPGMAGLLLSREATGKSSSGTMDPARLIKLMQSSGM